jgi:DNA-binding transcriptional ArsR family regulator
MSSAESTAVFFALGDPTRLAVVRRLAGGLPLSATALSSGAKISRQAIAKHLRVLEDAGVVSHQRQGREVLYALETAPLVQASELLEGVSAGWDRAIARLRKQVEKTSDD